MNERAVFDRLLRHGPASRAELAKSIRLSAPTVGKVVDELLQAGLLEEITASGDSQAMISQEVPGTSPGATPGEIPGAIPGGQGMVETLAGRPGRPGRTVRLNRSRAGIVAVQLGVHHTRVAALPVAGPMQEDWPLEFPTPVHPEASGDWIRALRRAVRPLAGMRPWAVMVGCPGVVDEVQGKVLLSPNLHWLEKADLSAMLGEIWECPVGLVQEIRALALGHLANQPALRDFLLVDVGAGVGGAAVLDGKLYASSLPLSGELGHTPVVGNDRPCGCGAIGCIETLVSRAGLLASLPRRRGPSPAWADLVHRLETVGIEPWLVRALDGLGVVIGGAMNVLGLRQVVVTGALNELPEGVGQHLAAAVRRASLWARFGEVACQFAPRCWARGLVTAAVDRVLLPCPAQAGDDPREILR